SLEIEEELTAQLFSEQFIPSIPKLEKAAFIVPKRERSTSWSMDEFGEEPEQELEPSEEDVPPMSLNPEADENEVAQIEMPDVVTPTLLEELEPQEPFIEQSNSVALKYDIMLGVNGNSPQYGILGEVSGRKIALDL